jgi:sec-independent protein translocase protein TatB
VFDLSLPKLLILAVLALVVFGPNELPKIASQAGRFLRDLRRIAEGAQADLREGLGPEFADFDVSDLHPRNFVTKHLLSDPDDATPDDPAPDDPAPDPVGVTSRASGDALAGVSDGQQPAYDTEAT